jgi:hypothetical protein
LSASEIVVLRKGESRDPQGAGNASKVDFRDSKGSDINPGPWTEEEVKSVLARIEVVRKSVVTAIESSGVGGLLKGVLTINSLLLLWFLVILANLAATTSWSPSGVPRRLFVLGEATPISSLPLLFTLSSNICNTQKENPLITNYSFCVVEVIHIISFSLCNLSMPI